jgi:nitrate/nitrite transport system substrate-binding protein
MSNFSRRQFLMTAGATGLGALLFHGCTSADQSNQNKNLMSANIGGSGVETTTARIGFLGQTDAAPLIIAQVKGLFKKYGVPDVQLAKQPSWGVTRDNLQLGSKGGGIDGGMILTPMAYQMALGTMTVNNKKIPMYIVARLNTGGQGISVGNFYKDLDVKLDTAVLKQRVEQAKAQNNPLRFAMTFKGGTSDVMLRYWLAAGGIDPVKDVSILVVPGPQLVANMRVRNIDGFCVGDPWHVRLINQKLGYTAVTTDELWPNHPEKALSFRGDWADKHPNTAKAILKAVMEAQQWCDRMENRAEMSQILADPEWAKVPVSDIQDRLTGKIDYGNNRPVVQKAPDFMRYWDNNASYPYKSHDLWFLLENIRWGNLPQNLDTKVIINQVNREDLWREAAKEMGVSDIPASPSKGVETFFDDVKFDPENPSGYLQSLKIKTI